MAGFSFRSNAAWHWVTGFENATDVLLAASILACWPIIFHQCNGILIDQWSPGYDERELGLR